jgi:hypothetical protein
LFFRQLQNKEEQTLLTQGGLVMAGAPFGMPLKCQPNGLVPDLSDNSLTLWLCARRIPPLNLNILYIMNNITIADKVNAASIDQLEEELIICCLPSIEEYGSADVARHYLIQHLEEEREFFQALYFSSSSLSL